MTATNNDFQQPLYETGIQQVFTSALPAATTIPAGTLAMADSSGRPVQFVDSTYQGGGIGFLGVASVRYVNSDASNAVNKRAMFYRNTSVVLLGKSGDAPDATLLGLPVYVADNITCKKTKTTGDLAVTLLEVMGNNRFRVWIA